MLLAAQTNGLVALVFAFALLTTVLAFRAVRRARQPDALPIARSGGEPALRPDAMRHWEVELHEIGRTLQARIDSKMSALEILIQQARTESERLERLLAEAKKLSARD